MHKAAELRQRRPAVQEELYKELESFSGRTGPKPRPFRVRASLTLNTLRQTGPSGAEADCRGGSRCTKRLPQEEKEHFCPVE